MKKRNAKQLKVILFGFLFLSFSNVSLGQLPNQQHKHRMEVKATVSKGCYISQEGEGQTFGNINFGVIPSSSAKTGMISEAVFKQSPSFSIECTPGATFSMKFDGGLQPRGNFRQVKSENGAVIPYTMLYVGNAGASDTYSIGIDQEIKMKAKGDGSISLHIIAGLRFNADAGPGFYKDTIIVTFDF